MSRTISVNLDEGSIQIFDGIGCRSLTEKIHVCKDCGRIHFLPVDEGDPCADHALVSLEEALDSGQRKLEDHVKRQIWKNFIALLVCVAGGSLVFLLSKMPYPLGVLNTTCDIIVSIGLFLVIMLSIYQIWLLMQVKDEKVTSDSMRAFQIRNFCPDKPQYQGQSWEDAILKAYAMEVGRLEKRAHTYQTTGEVSQDAWTRLYSDAMELSYMNDCDQLALLRLACLNKIALLPQSYTDICQIIKILPKEVLFHWLETLVTCIERFCLPFDRDTVEHFVRLADYSVGHIVDGRLMTPEKREENIRLVARAFAAIGPYYVLPLSQPYSGLKGIIERLIKSDDLYHAYS